MPGDRRRGEASDDPDTGMLSTVIAFLGVCNHQL